ncbi:MAG: hypothetical protein V1793_14985 [Pseudomonadota bacterium]
MRYLPVILILVLGLVSNSPGEELFLVTVVSVDRDRGTVHVRVSDTAESVNTPQAAVDSHAAGGPVLQDGGDGQKTKISDVVEISDQTLADRVQPGQIIRVWGDMVQTGSGMVLTPLPGPLPGMGESDLSGVRRRLKKSMGVFRGNMGMGHGKP